MTSGPASTDPLFVRVMALRRPVPALAAIAFGGIAALGQPPIALWILTLSGLIGLFALFPAAQNARRAGLLLWLFGTAYFAISLRWLVEPFQVEAEIFGWMAPFALALMAGGLAMFWAAAGAVAHLLGKGLVPRAMMALALCLAAAELARAYVFTGFPWAGFAQIWVDHGLSQTLAWIGPHGLGLLTLTMAAVPLALQNLARLVSLGGVAIAVAAGAFLAPLAEVPTSEGPVVRVIQPNAPQQEKWDPERAAFFFRRQIELTEAGDVPDLVVWPETAIAQLMNHAEETLAVVAQAARGAPVALGMLREENGRGYNSLLVVDGAGEVTAVYDKHHLVPFGEYMPFPGLFRSLGIRGLAARADFGFTPGPGPEIVTVGGLKALPMICYEAVFPANARVSGDRPDLLLQVTNDAWFGTYAGPQQHLAQARMRAIEQGLPLVRSANTGISAVIDARGRIVASIPLGQHGFVDAPLPMRRSPTRLCADRGLAGGGPGACGTCRDGSAPPPPIVAANRD